MWSSVKDSKLQLFNLSLKRLFGDFKLTFSSREKKMQSKNDVYFSNVIYCFV